MRDLTAKEALELIDARGGCHQSEYQAINEALEAAAALEAKYKALERAVIDLGRTMNWAKHTPKFVDKESFSTFSVDPKAVIAATKLVDLTFTLEEQRERRMKVHSALTFYRSRGSRFDKDKIWFYENLLKQIDEAILNLEIER